MNITICPQCKKPIEAKDYMNAGYLGMLESILPRIKHECGYLGLPIVVTKKEFEKKDER